MEETGWGVGGGGDESGASSTARTPAQKEMCTLKGEKEEKKNIRRAKWDWLTRPRARVRYAGGPGGAQGPRGRVLLKASSTSRGRLKRTSDLMAGQGGGGVAEELLLLR